MLIITYMTNVIDDVFHRIIEQGKHNELMNNHGKYFELANV